MHEAHSEEEARQPGGQELWSPAHQGPSLPPTPLLSWSPWGLC